ncbi:MAG: tyrosine-type recombinase/integrase [Acidobacteriota bacterium]
MGLKPRKPLKIADKPDYWGRLFQRFEDFKDAQEGVSQKTMEIYENTWKFFAPAFEPNHDPYQAPPTSQKDKERKVIEALQHQIVQRKRQNPPVGATTINIYTRVMNTFLRWLRDYEEEFQFLWQLKKQIVETGDTREIFSEDDVTKLRLFKPKTFNQRRAWTIAMNMLDNGMRIDEALSLTVPDVNFSEEMIRIEHGKGNKTRHVTMSLALKPILHRYIDKTMPPRAKYIFGTKNGTPLSQRNALRDIQVVQRKAKVKALSWHSYRHTFATGYLVRGGKIEKLQKILGHSRIETTLIYLHMANSYYKQDHGDFSSLTPLRRVG